MTPKTRSTASATLVALAMLCALTACASASRDAAATRRLYQPPVLRLSPGQSIQTPEGIYRPQVAEIWHSDPRYRDLERAYLDLLAAQANRAP